MSTPFRQKISTSVKNRSSKRRGIFPYMYIYGIILFILSIFAFWPVYFSILNEVRLTIHLHSVIATLWVITLIMQSWLARQKKFKKHKVVGKITYLLVPLFILFTLMLFHDFLNAESTFSQQLSSRITFYDLTGLIYFTAAFILAVSVFKKNIDIHARLMISTIVIMLFPIIGRLYLFYFDLGLSSGDVLELSIYTVDFIVLLMVVSEWWKGKIYPVFPILFGYIIFQHIGYVFSDYWPFWQSFVTWFAAL